MIGNVCVKFLKSLSTIYYTIKYRLICRLTWNIGKGNVFEGSIYFHCLGGKITIGNYIRFGPMVRIGANKGAVINIGSNVSINQGTYIVSDEYIEIGDDCRIGEYVSIRDSDHQYIDPNILIRKQGVVSSKTCIGNDVWICRGAVINKGVSIGSGSIIGANSVVTKDIPVNSVAVGIPAKIIKKRI